MFNYVQLKVEIDLTSFDCPIAWIVFANLTISISNDSLRK